MADSSKGDREKLLLLALLLTIAEHAIRNGLDTWIDGFDSTAAFAEFVGECRTRIETGRLPGSMRRRLQTAFLPTSDWDDCDGDVDLGNEISELIHDLYGGVR